MSRCRSLLLSLGIASVTHLAFAQCPATLPAANAQIPGPLPLFPADHWWNTDISAAPLDPGSASFIAYINNGGTRRLHPDFGGTASPGSIDIYGMPYVIVDGAQAKQAVTFEYWDESDGVNPATGQGVPFYPIPAQAITQSHWVEGGAPGNVDERDSSDRHLLIIDCTNRHLYELYNVYYDAAQGKWLAGSGAFFDMQTNNRRPDTWTSADAAGLAIFPGLVRYDEAWNSALTDIDHAFRVTVRRTNGYVYPASHRAGNTAGALPMGARLRLKKTVAGQDPALRTNDPNVQKIFRAMQKYGLIVADNGSDMYITGTFDTRWNNDILNPAFSQLSASDFEVVELGWKPTAAAGPALASIAANPSSVVAGNAATGSITLTAAATAPLSVALASASSAVSVPATVTVAAGATAATFGIATSSVIGANGDFADGDLQRAPEDHHVYGQSCGSRSGHAHGVDACPGECGRGHGRDRDGDAVGPRTGDRGARQVEEPEYRTGDRTGERHRASGSEVGDVHGQHRRLAADIRDDPFGDLCGRDSQGYNHHSTQLGS